VNADLIARQLRDIEGLDAIGYWPLAPGWWLLLAALLLGMLLLRLAWQRFARPAAKSPWRRDASLQLRRLRQRVGRDDAKQVTTELSELLRRIAMARCGRDACAGLMGEQWLAWLHQQDPKGFDWPAQGRLLISLPYAPAGTTVERAELLRLIKATQGWIADADHCPLEEQQV
jgi:pimeloyl-ACP methyl ester carboxylesterase